MQFALKRVLVVLAAFSLTVAGCARLTRGTESPAQTVGAEGRRPFDGVAPIEIPPEAHAMAAFLKAEVATNEGDRDEALKQYEEAVRYDPDNAELLVRLATLYVRDGRLKDALERVKHAVAIAPDSIDARLLAAGVSSALGDDGYAESQYREVLKLDPHNQEAYLYLGTLNAKRGNYDEALKIFQRLIDIDPGSFLGYYYAGRVMASAKNYPQAETYYRKALKLNPQSELVLLDLGVLREAEGKQQDAIGLYQKILQINPNNEMVRRHLADIYVGEKKYDQALGEFRRLEESSTTPTDTRIKIGLLYFERGDYDRAATEFNLVLGSEPDNSRVHYYLGTVYTELNENSKAASEFGKIPKGADHYVESRLQLAYLDDKDKRYDDAIAALQDALAQRPDDGEIIGFLVGVYREKKNMTAAIELAKKLVSLDPRNDKYHFTLGSLYDENKQKQDGVAEMRRAIELNPSNAQALNYLGYTYAEEGDHLDEAERLVKHALDIEPEDGFYVEQPRMGLLPERAVSEGRGAARARGYPDRRRSHYCGAPRRRLRQTRQTSRGAPRVPGCAEEGRRKRSDREAQEQASGPAECGQRRAIAGVSAPLVPSRCGIESRRLLSFSSSAPSRSSWEPVRSPRPILRRPTEAAPQQSGSDIARAIELTHALAERDRGLDSMQTPAVMEYSNPEHHLKAREVITVRRPQDLRIEALSPFGVALVVAAKDSRLAIFRSSDNTLMHGAATADTLNRFAQVPLAPKPAVDLLLGLAPDLSLLSTTPESARNRGRPAHRLLSTAGREHARTRILGRPACARSPSPR